MNFTIEPRFIDSNDYEDNVADKTEAAKDKALDKPTKPVKEPKAPLVEVPEHLVVEEEHHDLEVLSAKSSESLYS